MARAVDRPRGGGAGFPDPETLAVIERFSLWVRRTGRLSVRGRPTRRGVPDGLDFVGFAEYRPGMDLRHVDWGIYGRTGDLYVRQFADESAGLLAVLVDASGSMGVGRKWALARALGAALVHAALAELHEVLVGVATQGVLQALPVSSGSGFAPTAFDFLARCTPAGPTDLGATFGALPIEDGRGDAIVISDFLDPNGAAGALEALRRQGLRVDLVRITDPDEFTIPGGVLRDPEGAGHRAAPKGADRARLEARIAAHRAELVTAARAAGASLTECAADAPLPVALTQVFEGIAAVRGGG